MLSDKPSGCEVTWPGTPAGSVSNVSAMTSRVSEHSLHGILTLNGPHGWVGWHFFAKRQTVVGSEIFLPLFGVLMFYKDGGDGGESKVAVQE